MGGRRCGDAHILGGGMIASASAPVWMLVLGRAEMTALAVLMAALVWWRHRANIERLRAGTEPKIGRKS